MTNTTQEFKVGDQFIVTKQSFRDQGYTEVYTVSEVGSHGMVHFSNHDGQEALVYTYEIEHYTPEPEKHIHHDLIVAWAKDPKGCVIQVFDESAQNWFDCCNNIPWWYESNSYRIKPKTKEVQRWKWAFLSGGGHILNSTAYYTEEEALRQFKNATPYKLEHTAITETVEI